MTQRTEVISRPIVDAQDVYSSASVTASAGLGTVAPVVVASLTTRMAKKAFISALGNAVQAGGESYITFRLIVNGARYWPYDGSQNQWGDPANIPSLPSRLPIPQGALVQVVADNADTSNNYISTARIVVEYEDF